MEDRLILDGVDDDLGDKIIWQQLNQAQRGCQGEGGKIEKRWVWKLKGDGVEVDGDEG
jgi:hypothetical protein